ncbi:hypothetical protein AAVH_15111 [Aphelenchoides avenae]|nr:hypothetical protein AAVH_15111 [Aphelenchus avenae]
MKSARSVKCTFADCEWSTKGFPDAWKLKRHLRSHKNASQPSAASTAAYCTSSESSAEVEFKVEFVVGTKMVDRKRHYCLKWLGHDEVTWEPSGNLNSACSKAIDLFKEQMGWEKLPMDKAVYLLPEYRKQAAASKSWASRGGRKRKLASQVPKQEPIVKKLHGAPEEAATENAASNFEVAVDFKAASNESLQHTEESSKPSGRGPRTPPSSPVKEESSKVHVDDPAFSDMWLISEYFSRVFTSPLRAKAAAVFKEKSGLQELSVVTDPEQEKMSHDDSGFESEDLSSIASEPAADDRSPTISRCTTPMPSSPAKNEHWFNASFNVDLVCPFPERLLTVPSTTDAPPASMCDFRKQMSAALSVPLFGNLWPTLYTDATEHVY